MFTPFTPWRDSIGRIRKYWRTEDSKIRQEQLHRGVEEEGGGRNTPGDGVLVNLQGLLCG